MPPEGAVQIVHDPLDTPTDNCHQVRESIDRAADGNLDHGLNSEVMATKSSHDMVRRPICLILFHLRFAASGDE